VALHHLLSTPSVLLFKALTTTLLYTLSLHDALPILFSASYFKISINISFRINNNCFFGFLAGYEVARLCKPSFINMLKVHRYSFYFSSGSSQSIIPELRL